ncbi:winged helix-turn-helix domain-containing protein [Sphingomonas sp. DT-207]|uniref:winged helix-turn-helix domain-containing protein n=1 Tax=Sphingomonas sp. DT-207 TaxID=3396167 RepID=UPI003F1BB8F0
MRIQMTSHRIGDWSFDPEANELRRGDERRRLEHRAARTVELLCSRAGEVVTPDDILAQVWQGRAISANSVPVVISDLRQALEDDARRPRYIETVAKRGYRLMVEPPAEAPVASGPNRLRPMIVVLAALALVMAAALAWAIFGRSADSPALVVRPVQNATGNPAYQPLVNASSAMLMAQAEQLDGVQIFRGASSRKDAIRLESWLFIWNGRVTLMMSAQQADGSILWTGITTGGERRIPNDIARQMHSLGGRLRHKTAR